MGPDGRHERLLHGPGNAASLTELLPLAWLEHALREAEGWRGQVWGPGGEGRGDPFVIAEYENLDRLCKSIRACIHSLYPETGRADPSPDSSAVCDMTHTCYALGLSATEQALRGPPEGVIEREL